MTTNALGFLGTGKAALPVTDMEASIAWYRDRLGCEVVHQMDEVRWVELASPIAGLRFGLQGVTHFRGVQGGATLMFDVADIEATRVALLEKGVSFEGDIATIPDVVKVATFLDPTGNALTLCQDLQADKG